MAASQPIENQQHSYEVFEKKHYMECTPLRGGGDSDIISLPNHLHIGEPYAGHLWCLLLWEAPHTTWACLSIAMNLDCLFDL